MERRIPKPKEAVRFVARNNGKIAGAVAVGGIVLGTVMSGSPDKVIGIGGGLSAGYLAVRAVWSKRENETRD